MSASQDAARELGRQSCCARCCSRLCCGLFRRRQASSSWTELATPTSESTGSGKVARYASWSEIRGYAETSTPTSRSAASRKSERHGAPPVSGRSFTVGVVPEDLPTLGSFLDSYFEIVSDESGSEDEVQQEPPIHLPPRRFAVSAEAHGVWNQRHATFKPPWYKKNQHIQTQIFNALRECPFIASLDEEAVDTLVEALPVLVQNADECVMRQGEPGAEAFIVLSGELDCYNELEEDEDSAIAFKCRGRFVRTIPAGRLCGEMSMLWGTPRARSLYTRGSCMLAFLHRDTFQNLVVRHKMVERDRREHCLRQVAHLETLNDEQIAQLGDALLFRTYQEGDTIIRQGDWGNEFFIVVSGECVVEVETGYFKSRGRDVQEYATLGPSSLFGERALIERTTRSATIRASSENVEVMCLGRRRFERMLGPLGNLQRQHYLSDPRKYIADFYRPGRQSGPRATMALTGSVHHAGSEPHHPDRTEWFAVYRPTSRDAIAKMIGGTAVGKGLNVKGKSAKKNRLSGYVPFLQISDNAHKTEIEKTPPDSRLRLFFPNEQARASALAELQALISDCGDITTERTIHLLDDYPGVSGLDLPEPVLREAYIERPDLTPIAGWETGRKSEPAFMDMNFHALRGGDDPAVVLYQWDVENPMNPHGLLVAYAEEMVKPVVSDFDTFTVGSRGMKYDRLAPEQARLASWALDHTLEILRRPSSVSWNSRWLEVIKKSAQEGFHPDTPKCGFGDGTSYRLIESVVDWTKSTGAVRHGAESFNFYFPQELDEEYLIVWEKFPDKPWAYRSEEQMREFLLERIEDGFVFPINPVWPVRDEGYYKLFSALRHISKAKDAMHSWYPPDSGITEKIKAIHKEFPAGFTTGTRASTGAPIKRTKSDANDMDSCEKADVGLWRIAVKKAYKSSKKALTFSKVRSQSKSSKRGMAYSDWDPGINSTQLVPPSPRTCSSATPHSWHSSSTGVTPGSAHSPFRTLTEAAEGGEESWDPDSWKPDGEEATHSADAMSVTRVKSAPTVSIRKFNNHKGGMICYQ